MTCNSCMQIIRFPCFCICDIFRLLLLMLSWFFVHIRNSAIESGWHMVGPFASMPRRQIWPIGPTWTCSSSISTPRAPLLMGMANLRMNRLRLLELLVRKLSANRGIGVVAPYAQCRFSHRCSSCSGSHHASACPGVASTTSKEIPKRRSPSPRGTSKSRPTWGGAFIFASLCSSASGPCSFFVQP